MQQHKSIENSSSSIYEVETKISDVFEQIKKKSEEMPSSQSSVKLFNNLSNPTNLTNPQIIMDSKQFEQKLEERKNSKFVRKIKLKNNIINSINNSSKYFPKSNSEISLMVNKSCNLIKNDISKIIQNINNIDSIKGSQRNKILLKKIDKKYLNKEKNEINNNSYFLKGKRNLKKNIIFSGNISSSVKSLDSKRDIDDIWEKLKNSKNMKPLNKNKKTNEVKSFNKNSFSNDTYHIKLLQYNQNNKNERYQKICSDKDSQIKALEETIKQMEKIKNSIDRIYQKEYISHISSIINNEEKENLINNDIIKKKNIKLMEYKMILKKVNILKESKKNLIKWLYLQIQVKEKLVKIPEYYKYIIEENISLKDINKKGKNKIDKKEYDRILDYKGKNIYDDVTKFFKEYEILEYKAVERLNNNYDIFDKKLQLQNEHKNNINNIQEEISDDNKKINGLLKELITLKSNNIKLNKEFNIIKNNQNLNISGNNNKYLCDLSNKVLFHSKLDPNFNTSNYIYYKKDKSLLFNLILFLYKWISQNKFDEMKNYRFKLNYFLTDEKNMLNILQYAEIVIDLLLVEKKYYYSNQKLKKTYEKIEDIIDKEIKREKFLIQLKIQEQKDIEKNEKIKEKMKKIYFKYNRKIDFDYFRNYQNKKNKFEKNKIDKRETKFEDFFYDIYE